MDRPEDVLVLRALRHIEHVVELVGGVRIEARIPALVDGEGGGIHTVELYRKVRLACREGMSERASVLITSHLPLDEWTETFGSERLTGALLDRLTHHVHVLERTARASGSTTAAHAIKAHRSLTDPAPSGNAAKA